MRTNPTKNLHVVSRGSVAESVTQVARDSDKIKFYYKTKFRGEKTLKYIASEKAAIKCPQLVIHSSMKGDCRVPYPERWICCENLVGVLEPSVQFLQKLRVT